jgi:hypothetical protein
MSTSVVEIMSTTDLRKKAFVQSSTYKYRRYTPDNTSMPVVGSIAGTQRISFTLQDDAMNFAQSYLTFTCTIPANGANTLNLLHSGYIPIENVFVKTDFNAIPLVELQQANVFTRVVLPYTTSVEE